jgi:hypothetical protein
MQKIAAAESGTNTKLVGVEDEDRKKEILEELDIDAFELLAGKMNHVAMEHLHKQICCILH